MVYAYRYIYANDYAPLHVKHRTMAIFRQNRMKTGPEMQAFCLLFSVVKVKHYNLYMVNCEGQSELK